MFFDVNNDGWPSLLLVNGHVYPQVDYAHLGSSYQEPRLLYFNLGNEKFRDISKQSGPGITVPASSRGMAIADFWNDGRISAVVNNIDEKPMLLVNMAANANHWLGVITHGTRSNRDGIGARVTGLCERAPMGPGSAERIKLYFQQRPEAAFRAGHGEGSRQN